MEPKKNRTFLDEIEDEMNDLAEGLEEYFND